MARDCRFRPFGRPLRYYPDTAQFPDLQMFNHALADYCKGHPSLAYEPSNNTTTLGWQTSDLAHDDEKAVTVLLSCIEACVQQYLEARPVDPTHPYLCQRPAGWDYYLWGTVLGHRDIRSAMFIQMAGLVVSIMPPFRLVSIMTRRRRTETVGLSSGEAKRIRSRRPSPRLKRSNLFKGASICFRPISTTGRYRSNQTRSASVLPLI